MFDERLATNAAEWTVSDLSQALKRTLEDTFEHVRVRAEISNFRGPHTSGHVYFCLKDEGARLDAVIWKGSYSRLRAKLGAFKLSDGAEVIVTGRISAFPGKSSYQIVIESIEPAGVGALLAQLERLRAKLAAEGLFAPERKRPLPYLPGVIGVVTSPTGAVIRDILHRLDDRFPRRVLVWPVRVQGETSAAEVAAAIRGFDALAPGGPIPRPDVVIVARGGGSIEDLWGFNDEEVVRAAAASAIPIVAAVGHETDWTLIDHAADRRAPTPTGAAEMVVPVRAELAATVGDLARRHAEAALRGLERRRADLRSTARALPDAEGLLGEKRQRLDLVGQRLAPALARNARASEVRLGGLGRLLERGSPRVRLSEMRGRLGLLRRKGDPAISFKNRILILKDGLPEKRKRLRRAIDTRFAFQHQQLDALGKRLAAGRAALLRAERVRLGQRGQRIAAVGQHLASALQIGLDRRETRLNGLAALLATLSYKSVLARGFALVRDAQNQPVRSASAVAPGQTLGLEFADGSVRTTADGARGRRKAGGPGQQGSLFDA